MANRQASATLASESPEGYAALAGTVPTGSARGWGTCGLPSPAGRKPAIGAVPMHAVALCYLLGSRRCRSRTHADGCMMPSTRGVRATTVAAFLTFASTILMSKASPKHNIHSSKIIFRMNKLALIPV